jgi:hypothetical protein
MREFEEKKSFLKSVPVLKYLSIRNIVRLMH